MQCETELALDIGCVFKSTRADEERPLVFFSKQAKRLSG